MIVCSTNSVGGTGCPHEWNWIHILHHTWKSTQTGSDLYIRPDTETIKPIEENIGD